MTIAMISLCVAILLLSWVTWALNKKIEHLEKIVNGKRCNYPTHRTGGIDEYIWEPTYPSFKDLCHHYDSTVGLWATDRPELIDDKHQVLFQIKPIEGEKQ